MKKIVTSLFLAICLCTILTPIVASAKTNHTQDEAIAWIQARKAEKWAQNYDGSSYQLPQCVDLIAYYLDYLVGYHLRGNARDYVSRSDLPSGWTYQSNPSPGDIAVWGAGVGVIRSQWGHVALVESVSNGRFSLVDVNGETGRGSAWSARIDNPSTFIHPDFTTPTNVLEGIYYLRSALDNNLVVSVADESKEWGGNIRLEKYRGTASQRFKVCAFDGCYTIVNMNSQLSVDVSGASSEPGTNVQQYNYWPSETKAQQWYFEDSGDGYYYIQSALGTYLDVQSGVAADGQNVQTYTRNGSTAQKFRLDMSSPSINSVSIDEGVYCLHSALDDNLVIGVKNASTDYGANIELGRYTGTSSQQFIVSSFNGNYTIINKNSQLSLDVSGASSESGINVQQYHCWPTETKAQQWCFEDAGDGYYYIRSALGTYLDVWGGVAADGQNIQTYVWNGSAAQKFRLEQNHIGCTRIINLAKTASAVEVEIACFDSEAMLFCAAYTENGKMLGVECKPVAEGQEKYLFTLLSGNQVKAFLLDSKFRPLCEGMMI